MNRHLCKAVTFASLFVGSFALVPGIALAQQAPAAQPEDGHAHPHEHPRAHHEGLLGAALRLDSLSAEQRAAIEQLAQQRKAAAVPVRQADAQVLTTLARQVEQASIDPQALAPALAVEQSAAEQQRAVERDTLARLHAILTPAQRGELVDRIEARLHAMHQRTQPRGGAAWHRGGGGGGEGARLGLSADQKAQIRANLEAERQARRAGGPTARAERKQALESFRGDSFDPGALVRLESRGDRATKLARAMVPVLTPAQRATLADHLRARAARESRI
jgi:Spy/CpxP family protein refolding chaperone